MIPAAIVAIIVFIVAGLKMESKEGGEEMIRNVFVYLVLFATLMMVIGGSVGVFMALADIVAPAPYYQTYEEYKQWGNEKVPGREGEDKPKLTEAEIKANYDAMVKAETERQTIRAKNTLIKSLGWIVIPLPVFIYFQRRISRSEV
jgi:Ca2+/Na+ antiporter